MTSTKELNWAVLGVGVIANEMAQALQNMGKKLYAVGNRTHSKAVDFAENTALRRFMMISRIFSLTLRLISFI